LYLSLDNLLPAGIPFPEVTSQETLSSLLFPDSAVRVEPGPGTQVSWSVFTTESKTVSELPPCHFQLVKSRRQKKRRRKAEHFVADTPQNPADAKRMVFGRLVSHERQYL
jgi:hypothetical protein